MTKQELNRLRLRMRHLQRENDKLNLELLRYRKAFECLEGVAAGVYFDYNPDEKSLTMTDLYEVSNGLNPAEILDGMHDEDLLFNIETHSDNGVTQVFRENVNRRAN